MRVNLQTNLYNSNIRKISKNPAFQGEKSESDDDKQIKIMPFDREDRPKDIQCMNFKQKAYDKGYDHGYEDGYKDAKHNRDKLLGGALIGLAVLGLVNIYNTNSTRLELQEAKNEIVEQNALNDIEINERLDEIGFDTVMGDEYILEVLVAIAQKLKEIEDQQYDLKTRIESLPEGDEQVQELKDELKKLEEEYNILDEKYWDYMSEYQMLDENSNNEESDNDTSGETFEDENFVDPGFSVLV